MKKYLIFFLSVLFFSNHFLLYSQKKNEMCGFDFINKNLKTLNQNILNTPSLTSSTEYDSTTLYKIPVVFIVYHKGETEGVGSNIPSSTITNMLNGMNDAFRARNAFSGGRDAKIEFEPVKYNGTCSLLPFTDGIVRVNASSVSGFLTDNFIPGNPTIVNAIRDLHVWDDFESSSNFIKIEFIPYMDTYSGIVSVNGIWIDITKGLSPQVLTHEMGHMNGLAHTFYDDYGGGVCPNLDPNNPSGDGIDDTEPHKSGDKCPALSPSSINSCTGNPFGEVLNNFMSYSDISCINKFSRGQIRKMRNQLTFQQVLLNSRYLNGLSNKPQVFAAEVCGAGNTTYIASFFCQGTVKWYNSLTSTTVLSSSSGYTTPPIFSDISYFTECQTASCGTSPRLEVPVKIVPLTDINTVVVTGNERCGEGSVTLTASGCSGVYSWVVNGESYNPWGYEIANQITINNVKSNLNYTIRCKEVNKCWSNWGTKQIIINKFAVENEAFTCTGYFQTLKASGCNGTYRWFASISSNTPFAQTTSGTTYISDISASSSYYVECVSNYCGTSPKLEIKSYFNTIPPPILVDGYGCIGNSVGLEISNKSCIGGVVLWYDNATTSTILASGRSYLTPILSSSRTYYTACQYTQCPQSGTSTRSMVLANMQACNCVSAASQIQDEDIFNVTLGSLNNSSTCSQTGSAGSIINRYSNYKHLQPPALTSGNSHPFSVQVGTCGGNYNNSVKIFIDFNRDGDFDDINEVAFASANTVRGPNTVSGSINIPNTITDGLCVMRVIVNENPSSSTSACSSNTYLWGETEDYFINIKSNICNIIPPTASSVFACQVGEVVLTATGCAGGNIQWWSALNNGVLLKTGNSFTTPKIESDKTYYVLCNIGSCNSDFIASEVKFSGIKDIFTNANLSTIPGQAITLIASGCANETRWYNSSTSNSPLQIGTSYNTGALSNSTTYYVSCHDNITNCATPRIKIDINVQLPCPNGELLLNTVNYLNGEVETKQANSISGFIKASNDIGGSSRINYEAKYILLENGFSAIPNTNGVFTVKIGGCN